MSDTRTPQEIERELEQNREGLQNTIHALQETFQPDMIWRSITDNVAKHGGGFGQSVSTAARENPLALAVTGIGLGWLIFGRGPSADRIEESARGTADGLHYTGGRKTAYGEGADAEIGTRGPVPKGSGPDWYEGPTGPTMTQRAKAGMHNAGRDASARAGRVRDRSSDMMARLSQGTEDLGHDARERIIAARERAVEANERAGTSIRQGADRASDFFEEHPIVVGALAFAVGAAIAGSLPRTKYEDDHFGAQRDEFYDDAERIFAEERAKAERVAGAALDEASKTAREAKDKADAETSGQGTAADAAVDETERTAGRIADAAERQAQKEDFGPSRG